MEEKSKKNIIKIVVVCVIIVVVILAGVLVNRQIKKNEAKAKIEDAKSQISEALGTITKDDTKENNSKEDKEFAQVKMGQKITIEDYLQYTFVKSKFSKKIEPSNPDSYYSYYEAKGTGNILLSVQTDIKNLTSTEFNGKNIPKATIIYDNKYEYSCNIIVEEDDGSDLEGYDWYMNIQPLKSKKFYYYVEIPKEFEKDEKSLALRITLQDYSYELKIK